MTQKNKKQFGVWMDTHHATVVGRATAETEDFTILAVAGNAGAKHNTSEKNEQNAEEVHLTGTGTSQEQLMRYMAETPQFKNTVTQESTSNKMSDENLAAYIGAKFN